ncbi:MAG TPA: winged helix-turn-helix domain-containing protein, partial [Candidatus Binatia bacterium]|nr:winged helix-turn-helix domain-containing protein [Candidatus Binatia bacterium]
MGSKPYLFFSSFRLDLEAEQLWRGAARVPLRPKPFALLRYLVEQAGRLVSKAELRQALWPEAYVSEGLLKGYIRDLRAVLGDDPEAPQFIETVARRGYRFIASLTTQPVASSTFQVSSSQSAIPNPHSAITLVGREPELARLHDWLEKSCNGWRQVVFVTGEPGIGKTTLVDAFLQQAAAGGGLWLGRGQCIEHYGAGEAYLPILAAVGRLCRAPDGERLIA